MDALTIPVVVGPDQRLIIDPPPSTPIKPADVAIHARGSSVDKGSLTRVEPRAAPSGSYAAPSGS